MTTTSTATVFGSTTTAAPPDDLQAAIALALMGYGSEASAQTQAQAQAAANAARYASGFGDPASSAYTSAFTTAYTTAFSSGGASTPSTPAPVYTVTAADMSSANPWAAIANTLYGTNDPAAAAQLQASQAALGKGVLSSGLQLAPPASLSFESSQATTASLITSALTTIAAGWKPLTALESSATGAYEPQVAYAANGDGLSVWMQGPDLMASVFTKATGLWSAPTAIDGNLPGDVYLPQLSVSANGNMLVTWLQYDPITYVSNTYARRYVNGAWDATATTIPKLNAGVPSVYFPVGAISDSGRAVVLFASSDGQWNMVANTFNGSTWQSTASNLDDVGAVNNNSVSSALLPRVAMDAAGNATALWVQSATGETAASLMVSRYSVATGKWSAPSSTALENTTVNVDAFRIASDNQGNALVAWRQGSSLFAKSYTASTAQWSAVTTLSSTASGDPSLSMAANGNAVISYTHGTEVHARRYTAGAWQGSAQLLGSASTSVANAARTPSAAINSRGDIIVTFLQSGGTTPGTNTTTTAEQVYSQRFLSQSNSWSAPEATQTAPGAAQKPVAAIDEQGNAQVLMALHSTGDNTHSIYSRRFAQSEQYFEIPTGATWESLTQQLYGTSESAAVSALQALLSPSTGLPSQSPTPGTRLHNLPETLNYQRPVAQSATINPEALMRASAAAAAVPPAATATAPAPAPAPAPTPTPAPTPPAPIVTIESLMAVPTPERQAAQERVDALITYASRQYTELASAMSAAAFAQTSLQTWNQMRAQHQAAHGSLSSSTGWSESDYQSIVATAARTQTAAEQATAVRHQVLYEMQSAQAALNVHIDAAYAAASGTVRAATAAASAAASAAAIGAASTPTAVFGGGGVPSTSTAPLDAATLAALAILGTGAPAANAAALATVLAAIGAPTGTATSTAPTGTPTNTAVFGGGGVPSSNTSGPDAITRAALALLGYGTLANNLAALTQPPRERPASQWADIQAVWLDRNDEPALLMQLMRQYGFDAADLAYATGQTLAQVGGYLQQHGAADGFAGWSFSRGYVGSGLVPTTATMATALPTAPRVTLQASGLNSDRLNHVLSNPPRERPAQQWADIQAVWLDRSDEPALLMDLMRQYGFDAADLAYATGQTLTQVGSYLQQHGAADGFAGWSFIGGYVGTGLVTGAPANSGALSQRPPEQWAAIQAVWLDRRDEPYRLMQTMVEFGFNAADIAYATGQSAQAVGDYLTLNGAPAGFAGAVTVGQRAIDAAYLQALDKALSFPVSDYAYSPGSLPRGWSITQLSSHHYDKEFSFDIQEFNRWYLTQATPENEAFLRLHGPDFSLSGAELIMGRWETRTQGQNDYQYWQPSRIQWPQPGSQIQAYLSYPRATTQELRGLDLSLNSQENLALLQHYRSSVSHITQATLPQNEQIERLRALCGSQRTVQMLQIMQATRALHADFIASGEQIRAQPPALPNITRSSSDVFALPAGQLTWQEAAGIVLPAGWDWAARLNTVQGRDGPIGSTTGYVPVFDWRSYTQWYAAQGTPASQLFAQRYGARPDVTSRTDSWGGGETELITSTGVYLNEHLQFVRDGQVNFELLASSGLVALDPYHSRDDLRNPSYLMFDPLYGLVTSTDNIKDDANNFEKFMSTAVPLGIALVAGIASGGTAAGAIGGTLGTVVGAGVGAAVTSTIMGFVATGKFDLEAVLKSAVVAMATAGFAQLSGLKDAGLLTDAHGNVVHIDGKTVIQNWGEYVGSLGAQTAFSGLMSEIIGGEFKDGVKQFIVNNLASSVVSAINVQLQTNAQLSGTEKTVLRSFSTAIGSAIKILGNDGDPLQTLALDYLNELGLKVSSGNNSGGSSTDWASAPINGLTDDDGWTMAGGGGGSNWGGVTNPVATPQFNPTLTLTIRTDGFVRNNGEFASSVPATVNGALKLDTTAPAVPEYLLPQGVRASSVFGARDESGKLFYFVDGSDEGYNANLFTSGAQAILDQGEAGLQNSSITPSQYLEASRFLSAVNAPVANAASAVGGMITLGSLSSNGLRVITIAAKVRDTLLTLATPRLLPWTLLLYTGDAQEQVLNLNDSQRFVTRRGEVFGKMQQLGPDGQWHTSPSSVALVDIGSQRVALTPEELAWLSQPTTTPGTPLPPPPPLINVPLAPGELPSNLLPGQSIDQLAPSGTTTTPAEPVLTWEDLIITADGLGGNNGPFTPSRTNPTGMIGGTATGDPEANLANAEPGKKADILAQNNALGVVANYGYLTEQSPVLTPEERVAQGISETANPDARIEGRVFDVKASKSPQSAETAIEDSVGAGQARRFVITTEHFENPDAGARELATRLRNNPIPGLQEVKVIVYGVLRNIYP